MICYQTLSAKNNVDPPFELHIQKYMYLKHLFSVYVVFGLCPF